jgi:toxin ParE1/3/4
VNLVCIIRPAADEDLDRHVRYLARQSHVVAWRFHDAANEVFQKLASMPHLGGTVANVRDEYHGIKVWAIKGFPNHLILYRPLEHGIEVLRILHGAQDWQAIVGSENVSNGD